MRYPVEDGDEGGVVLLGRTQQMPRHGVGVAGGGRHHDPDVRRADEFGGQDTVAYDERVDVGGVQQGEAARQPGGGLDAQGGPFLGRVPVGSVEVVALTGVGGLLGRQPDAGELGQHPDVGEPVMIIRMADEHRRARGRPQHPGFADAPSDE